MASVRDDVRSKINLNQPNLCCVLNDTAMQEWVGSPKAKTIGPHTPKLS